MYIEVKLWLYVQNNNLGKIIQSLWWIGSTNEQIHIAVHREDHEQSGAIYKIYPQFTLVFGHFC